MSWRFITAVSAAFFLASCGGNPFVDTTGGTGGGTTDPGTTPGTSSGIPAALKGNLQSVTYDETAGTLSVVIVPLDSSPQTLVFNRDPARDTSGFLAFSYQETSSLRYTLGLAGVSADGNAVAGLTGSGQFAQVVWGSAYAASNFAAPAAGGLATYSGDYVGILNTGSNVPGSIFNPGSPFQPGIPFRVTGQVMINADFTDSSVEGAIGNRTVVEDPTIPVEPDVFFEISSIAADGSFAGNVIKPDLTVIGTYGGAFGGADATSVAGAVEMDHGSNLLERGIFVADQCAAGDPPPCP